MQLMELEQDHLQAYTGRLLILVCLYLGVLEFMNIIGIKFIMEYGSTPCVGLVWKNMATIHLI